MTSLSTILPNQKAQLLKVLSQKQELIKQLVERCSRQQKRLTGLLAQQNKTKTTLLQFSSYQKYIFQQEINNQKLSFVCFRVNPESVTNQQTIIASNNLQLYTLPNQHQTAIVTTSKTNKQFGTQAESQDRQFQNVLSKNVDDLKQNIQKCQTLISNLKELKELEQNQGQKRQKVKSQNLIHNQFQKEAVTQQQQSQTKSLQKKFSRYFSENQKLRQKVKQLQQAQRYYLSVIEDLQIQRIKYQKGSPAKQLLQLKKQVTPNKQFNKQKRKAGRVYLVNY